MRHGGMETWGLGDIRSKDIEIETLKQGDIDMEKWRSETWRQEYGDMEMETWRHQIENGSLGDFPYLFTVCSSFKQKFVGSYVRLLTPLSVY
jgi:hypothetical protein